MKKFTALVLGLSLILSMSLSVNAGSISEKDNTTTHLTVTVPDPSYTINIPKDTELTYGDTARKEIGQVSLSNVANLPTGYEIRVAICAQSLNMYTDTGSVSIPVSYYFQKEDMSEPVAGTPGSDTDPTSYYSAVLSVGGTSIALARYVNIFAEVASESWAAATAGNYTADITFSFSVEQSSDSAE